MAKASALSSIPVLLKLVNVPTEVISVCAGFTFAVVTASSAISLVLTALLATFAFVIASSAISPVAIVPSVIPKDFIFVNQT